MRPTLETGAGAGSVAGEGGTLGTAFCPDAVALVDRKSVV